MKSHEFDKFLRDHKMDVESVTSPAFDLPTLIESWSSKNSKTQTQTTKLHDIKSFEEYFDNSKKFESTTLNVTKMDNLKSLTTAPVERRTMKLVVKPRPLLLSRNIPIKRKRIIDDFDRYKRYSEGNKLHPRNFASFRSHKTTEGNYYGMFKKKMKLFEKKATEPERQTDVLAVDPRNKEVEITIINFDDIDKMSTTIKAYESYSLPQIKKEDSTYDEITERSEITESSEMTTLETTAKTVEYYSPKEVPDAMHNELLYKDIFKERTVTESTTTESTTPLDFEKNTEYVEPTTTVQTTVSVNSKLRYPFDFLNKIPHMKNMDLPKRVHISSHHYKYDIFFNEDKTTPKTGYGGCKYPY